MLIVFLNAVSWLESHQLPCLFREMFHIDCPGCGFQRSLLALVKGDIMASIGYWPAMIPMLTFFIFLLADRKFHFRRSEIISKTWLAVIFIIILASYIYKLTYQNGHS